MKILGKEYKRIKRRINTAQNRVVKQMMRDNYDVVDCQISELLEKTEALISYHNVLEFDNQQKLRFELDKILVSCGMKNVDKEQIAEQAKALQGYIISLEDTDVIEKVGNNPNWSVLGKVFDMSYEELDTMKLEHEAHRKRKQ